MLLIPSTLSSVLTNFLLLFLQKHFKNNFKSIKKLSIFCVGIWNTQLVNNSSSSRKQCKGWLSIIERKRKGNTKIAIDFVREGRRTTKPKVRVKARTKVPRTHTTSVSSRQLLTNAKQPSQAFTHTDTDNICLLVALTNCFTHKFRVMHCSPMCNSQTEKEWAAYQREWNARWTTWKHFAAKQVTLSSKAQNKQSRESMLE